jgi:nicotinate-nucleotide adenylyltransferase
MTRVGILGGSFDPVHEGHLAIAKYASSELNLDRVYFVPVSQNPLKKNMRQLPDSARVTLLRKALRRFPNFLVSDCEIRRQGPSYTVETLRHFRKKLGKKAQLYFLAGADTARYFSRWKSPKKVLKLCRFVVMTRPGFKFRTADGRFLWLPMSPLRISSTQIRRRLQKKRNVCDLVPAEIEKSMKNYGGIGISKPRKRSG